MTGKPFVPRDCTRCGTPLVPKRNTRGMCNSCYKKDQRQDPNWHPLPVPSLRERVLSRLIIDPSSGCLVWTGHVNAGGYGHVTARPYTLDVHRLVYEMFAEPIPDDHELDHLCHTNDLSCPGGDTCPHRRCASPAHLEPVTPLINTRRVVSRSTPGPFNPHSDYRGVSWKSKSRKWQARIYVPGGKKHLGLFVDEADAARAYDAAARALHGDHANVNFPEVAA